MATRIFVFVSPTGDTREFFTEHPENIFVAYARDGRVYVKEVTRDSNGNWIASDVYNQELVGATIQTTSDLLPRMIRLVESNTGYVVYNPEFEGLDTEEKARRAYRILKAIQLVTGDRIDPQNATISHQESAGAMQQVQDALNIPIPTVPGIATPNIVFNITAQGGYATADSDSASTSNSSAQAEATADAVVSNPTAKNTRSLGSFPAKRIASRILYTITTSPLTARASSRLLTPCSRRLDQYIIF